MARDPFFIIDNVVRFWSPLDSDLILLLTGQGRRAGHLHRFSADVCGLAARDLIDDDFLRKADPFAHLLAVLGKSLQRGFLI